MLQRQNRKDCSGTQPSFRDRYIQLANATSPSVDQKQIPLSFRIFKRCFDVVLALLAIVLLSPLLLCVAIAIKTTSAGPVIFKQERYGRNKKPFICYKFRSMTVDTPSDVPTRVMCERSSVMTPIGPVLRKTSIDELPQLINIVRGDIPLRILKTRPEFSEKSMGAFALPAKSSTNKGKVFSQVVSCFASGLRTRRAASCNCNLAKSAEVGFLAKPIFGAVCA